MLSEYEKTLIPGVDPEHVDDSPLNSDIVALAYKYALTRAGGGWEFVDYR